MNGVEIMLKSFGLDPEKIKEQIGQLTGAVGEVDKRLSNIEQNQKLIIERLDILMMQQPGTCLEYAERSGALDLASPKERLLPEGCNHGN
jgi:hypothetical protein